MKVSADHTDEAQMEKLITIAERGCIVANTLKESLKLSINLG
jgi:putative redox protein